MSQLALQGSCGEITEKEKLTDCVGEIYEEFITEFPHLVSRVKEGGVSKDAIRWGGEQEVVK